MLFILKYLSIFVTIYSLSLILDSILLCIDSIDFAIALIFHSLIMIIINLKCYTASTLMDRCFLLDLLYLNSDISSPIKEYKVCVRPYWRMTFVCCRFYNQNFICHRHYRYQMINQ